MPSKSREFRKLNVSGTFDILHNGHELLFHNSFELSDIVVIGLTTDKLVKQLSKSHSVTSYETRLTQLEKFFEAKGWLSRAQIQPIDTVYGFAPEMKELEAIVTSQETRKRALDINRMRHSRGLKPLKIIVVAPFLDHEGKPVSVTRIRAGEIDIHGRAHKEKAPTGTRRGRSDYSGTKHSFAQ
ncbi:MAG: phosphopantetheine adenylyltransferase [Candidatus Bathyarchaeia archaeon]